MDRRGFLKLIGGVAAGALSPLSLRKSEVILANGMAPTQRWVRTESTIPIGKALGHSWTDGTGNHFVWMQMCIVPHQSGSLTVTYSLERSETTWHRQTVTE